MATQVIQAGGTIRVIVNPRAIADTSIAGGYLIITYTDGTTENVGYIGGGGAPAADIFNTAGVTTLRGVDVVGFEDAANDIDARLTALGY